MGELVGFCVGELVGMVVGWIGVVFGVKGLEDGVLEVGVEERDVEG